MDEGLGDFRTEGTRTGVVNSVRVVMSDPPGLLSVSRPPSPFKGDFRTEGTRTGAVIIPVFGPPPVISHSSNSSKSDGAKVYGGLSSSLVIKGEDDAGGSEIREETNVFCISVNRSDARF